MTFDDSSIHTPSAAHTPPIFLTVLNLTLIFLGLAKYVLSINTLGLVVWKQCFLLEYEGN